MKFCEECGAQLEDDAVFCEECGAAVASPSSSTVPATPATASTDPAAKTAGADQATATTGNAAKSKGGIIALCIVLLLAGGIGIYFSGILGTNKPDSQNKVAGVNNTAVPSSAETTAAAEATATPTVSPTPAPTPTPSPTPKPTPKGDNTYLLPKSGKKYYKESELAKFSKAKLRLARNEIFARHGYIFDDKELLKYFKKKAWYHPKIKPAKFSNDIFNKYEKKNIDLISALENGNSLQKKKDKWEGYYENDTSKNVYNEFGLTIYNVTKDTFEYEVDSFTVEGSYEYGEGYFGTDDSYGEVAYLTLSDGCDYFLGYSDRNGCYCLKTVDGSDVYMYYDLVKY